MPREKETDRDRDWGERITRLPTGKDPEKRDLPYDPPKDEPPPPAKDQPRR